MSHYSASELLVYALYKITYIPYTIPVGLWLVFIPPHIRHQEGQQAKDDPGGGQRMYSTWSSLRLMSMTRTGKER